RRSVECRISNGTRAVVGDLLVAGVAAAAPLGKRGGQGVGRGVDHAREQMAAGEQQVLEALLSAERAPPSTCPSTLTVCSKTRSSSCATSGRAARGREGSAEGQPARLASRERA